MPTYDEVRAETEEVLEKILDIIPQREGEVDKRPFDPYPCDDVLIGGRTRGAFYTGQCPFVMATEPSVPVVMPPARGKQSQERKPNRAASGEETAYGQGGEVMRDRRRVCAFVLLGLLGCAAPACAMPPSPSLPQASPSPTDPPPTFDQVRQEIDSLIARVADLVPEPKEVVIIPDGEPLSCSDPLVGGHGKGSVYTGRAKIYVDPATDISELVNSIPPRLGEGWVVVDLGLDLHYPETYVQHRATPWMDLSVDKILRSDRTGISLSAISRCGVSTQ